MPDKMADAMFWNVVSEPTRIINVGVQSDGWVQIEKMLRSDSGNPWSTTITRMSGIEFDRMVKLVRDA